MVIFPDLVLTSADRGKKLVGTVEVETSESVNHFETRAQWAHLGRAKAPFHLYGPAGSVEIARLLAAENGVNVSEIWSYHTIGDQTRFTLVHRSAPEPRHSTVAATPRASAPPVKPAATVKRAAAEKKRPVPAARRGTAPPSRTAARRKAAAGRPQASKPAQKRK